MTPQNPKSRLHYNVEAICGLKCCVIMLLLCIYDITNNSDFGARSNVIVGFKNDQYPNSNGNQILFYQSP